MQFISESVINQVIDHLAEETAYLATTDDMLETQKDLMNFIDEENQSLLAKNELAILQFLTVVICKSVQHHYELKTIPGKLLEEAEENNWEVFHDPQMKTFSNVLDKYFECYHQEDLLALVEDSIQDDENSDMSQPGKEMIFVAAKSIIDVLDKLYPNPH